MKKVFVLWLVLLFFAYDANTGCTLSGGDIVLPNISSLKIQSISTFVAGNPVTVILYSSSLNPGTYVLHYRLDGANVFTGDTAVVNMYNDSGSFSTPVLANPGNTTLTLTEITTSSGGNAWVSDSATFSDSIGLMTANTNTSAGAFRAIHVTATLTGTLLSIRGICWKPLDTVSLNIDNYTNAAGTFTINTAGDAIYSIPKKRDSAAYGVITVLQTSPLLKGTFSFTNKDSSKVSAGTFSCAAP